MPEPATDHGRGACQRSASGGQNSRYLINQLMRYRAGDRADAPDMTSGAKQLDSGKSAPLAAYLASQ